MYGNSLGHKILEEREEYRSRLNNLEAQMQCLKEEMAQLRLRLVGEIDDLQSEVKQLKGSCEGYRMIRSRYL